MLNMLSAAVGRSPILALVTLVTLVVVFLVALAFAADVLVGLSERDDEPGHQAAAR
jgi:hypothetical protein